MAKKAAGLPNARTGRAAAAYMQRTMKAAAKRPATRKGVKGATGKNTRSGGTG